MKIFDNMPYIEHFLEIKKRFICCIIFILLASLICYIQKEYIFKFLIKPIYLSKFEGKIIYTNLTEAFFSYLKISLISGFFISAPFVIYNVYSFLALGLYQNEKKVAKLLFLLSIFLFYSGCALSYFVVIPNVWDFFLNFQDKFLFQDKNIDLILQPKISEYINLSVSMIVAFGFAFQLPVLIILLVLIKIISIETLKKNRRIAILINFIIAGIITPPDVLSQIALGVPMVFLYEIAIISSVYIHKKNLC